MIYSQNYGSIRQMTQQDIPAVLTVMRPFVEQKILLPRTDYQLLEKINDYIVYEIDGGIRACAALHIYSDNQAEIAAVAVDETFSNLGIGPKMIEFLIKRAKSRNVKSIFILTTRTSDWFEKIGFCGNIIIIFMRNVIINRISAYYGIFICIRNRIETNSK